MDDSTAVAPELHPLGVQLTQLRALVRDLAAFPTFGVPDHQLPELVQTARATVSQVQSVYLNLLAQGDACEIARKGKRQSSTQTWMANNLHVKPGTAKFERLLANEPKDRPLVAAALASGAANVEQAAAIIKAIDELPSDRGAQCQADVERVLVGEVDRKTPAALKKLGMRIRAQLDPERAEAEEAERLARQERDAHDRRYLRLREDGYGSLRLSVAEAVTLRAILDILAKPHPASDNGRDPRTAEQRMADALVQMAELVQLKGVLPDNGGDRPVAIVTIPYLWLLAKLRGEGVIGDTDTRISPTAARRFACAAKIIPMVLNGKGEPLDVGRAERFFTPAQRKAIAQRDRHCVHPGCNQPPRWCSYHHIKHWVDGGATDISNGVLLCTFHHHLYDTDEWTFICDGTGPTHVIPPTFIDVYQEPIPIQRD